MDKSEKVELTPPEQLREENIAFKQHLREGIAFILKQAFDAGVKFGKESSIEPKITGGFIAKGRVRGGIPE